MRTCTWCKESKELTEFGKQSSQKDGIHSWCKVCVRAKAQAYRDKNPDYVKKHNDKRDPQAMRDSAKAWRAANPDAVKAMKASRRGLGKFPKNVWPYLIETFGAVCLKCGATESLTLDHVVPVALGGENTIENAQILCHSCNASKGHRSSADYREKELISNG